MKMTDGEKMVWAAAFSECINDQPRGYENSRLIAVNTAATHVEELRKARVECEETGCASIALGMLRAILETPGDDTSSVKVGTCEWLHTHDSNGFANHNTCQGIGMHKFGDFCPHCGRRIVVKERC